MHAKTEVFGTADTYTAEQQKSKMDKIQKQNKKKHNILKKKVAAFWTSSYLF